MSLENRNHQLIVQFLLGELPEEEVTRLEKQYFDDDDFFEQLQIVEGDLIDAYLRGDLGGRERNLFESHFLTSPARRQRVELAGAFVEYATRSSAGVSRSEERRQTPAWWRSILDSLGASNKAFRLALAAAVLVIAAGGSFFFVETVRLGNRVERIQTERSELLRREEELQRRIAEQLAHTEQLENDLQHERSQRQSLEEALTRPQNSNISAINFFLSPDLIRGAGELKSLTIPGGVELVRIHIDLGQDDYNSYRAVLETVAGKRIWTSSDLKAQSHKSGKVITIGLPASIFARGDHILTLSGMNSGGNLEDVGDYYFNVVKK